ncbi:MAG TPA: hypothetical protein VHT70_04565 [Candidatus Saccharimonadales bacterium]|jgi:hypothetical protein|nr:hypothetical protein [Candidatus Saccharimonadales bacterium]
MTIWWLVLILSFLFAFAAAFLWIAIRLGRGASPVVKGVDPKQPYQQAAENDVEHIFNEEFREELRNRGRLHFEKIIGENAMFLQQDLRLTTSQINDYMKQEISKSLQEAFQNYQNALGDAKQLAVDSIEKTKATIEEQRQLLTSQLEKEVTEEKARRVKHFEDDMADIINHYVLAAVGNQIDLSDQLEYILSELETHKQEIVEDVKSGA